MNPAVSTTPKFIWKDHYNKYIQLQRNHATYNAAMLEKLIRGQQKEITVINSFLKRTPRSVLDIGCGLGIFDLAIHDFYKGNSSITYHLLDKTTTPEEEKNVYYGHRETGAFYNNLNYTKEFLTLNGITPNNINCITVDDDNVITNGDLRKNLSNIDLIISIISWGFHYPVSTYLDTVHKILADDGLACFHCRNIGENLSLVQTKFEILSPTVSKNTGTAFLICRKKK